MFADFPRQIVLGSYFQLNHLNQDTSIDMTKKIVKIMDRCYTAGLVRDVYVMNTCNLLDLVLNSGNYEGSYIGNTDCFLYHISFESFNFFHTYNV